ncbi:MAG: M42 family metallopeptidase [Gudongella sp.]|jgi:endoglucanase|nr:M42 family metallopeptidase [Gudongella sp.]
MLLKRLTEAAGVSGNEKEVRDIIIEEIKPFADSIRVDRIGNIIAYKSGNRPASGRLMITAHMDEVGLMIKDIDSNGLLKFAPVGGIDKRVLVSKTVRVGKEKIKGVIGSKPIHLQRRDEWTKVLGIDELYIDIGCDSKEEASKHVSIGDFVIFDTEYEEFGDGKIKAKALDNRVGCSVLIDYLKSKPSTEVFAVFTVMEEIGLVGAGPAAFSVEPDVAIILEGTICYEMPDLDSHHIPTTLGEGPAISLADRTTIYDRKLIDKIAKIAEDKNIKYQYRKTAMGGNDSGKVHISKTGSKTCAISVPTRYIHSPLSVISKDDYDSTLSLLKALVSNLEREAL